MDKSPITRHMSLRELVSPWDFKEKKHLPSLTWRQIINFGTTLFMLPFKLAWWTFTYALPGAYRPVGLKQRLINKSVTYFVDNVSLDELRIIVPVVPLRELMESPDVAAVSDLPHFNHYFHVEHASARWIAEVDDRKEDDPVILYLHGGAFLFKATPPQVLWMGELVKALPKHRLSVLMVDYTVAPQGQFPTQLHEAFQIYEELSKTCSKIIVCGDSAGGNLASTLTAHIVKNDLPVPKPWAVVLVSPWEELEETEGSYQDNSDYDYLYFGDVHSVALMYAGTAENLTNPYVNPKAGGKEFWHEVFPERTLGVWGDREILLDGCRRFADMANIKTNFEEPEGIHDVMVLKFGGPSTEFVVKTLDKWLS